MDLRLARSRLFREHFLGVPMGVLRIFKSLLAEFVGSQMVPFAVCDSGSRVGMLRQVVKFRRSFVGALGHRFLLTRSMKTNISCVRGETLRSDVAMQLDSNYLLFPRNQWIPVAAGLLTR